MAANLANEIEKKYGLIDFFDPRISFGYNEIQFESKLTFLEELYVFLGFLAPLITIFIAHSLWMTILFAGGQLYYMYELITSRNIAKIDFLKKQVQITNPIWLINDVRKIFKRPTEISFHKIHSFKNYKRSTYWMKSRQNILVAKFHDHSPIKIAKFRFERDSGTMAELLNQYVVGKPRIID
jgi:hypothetical protein